MVNNTWDSILMQLSQHLINYLKNIYPHIVSKPNIKQITFNCGAHISYLAPIESWARVERAPVTYRV